MLRDFEQVATDCMIDQPTLWRWVRDGIIPRPFMLDGLVRWAGPSLETWAALACPSGPPFHAKQLTALRRAWLREKRERIERERETETYLSKLEA